jgi:hypothetical protein
MPPSRRGVALRRTSRSHAAPSYEAPKPSRAAGSRAGEGARKGTGGRRGRRAAARRGRAGTARRGSVVWEPPGWREAVRTGLLAGGVGAGTPERAPRCCSGVRDRGGRPVVVEGPEGEGRERAGETACNTDGIGVEERLSL